MGETYENKLAAWPEWSAAQRQQAEQLLEESLSGLQGKIIVLDDDPTGVQTVHGVSVYTDWSLETMLAGFRETNRIFFILTNSRGLVASETTAVHREIAEHAAAASKQLGMPYLIISRGDSTLRGHYPLETEVLRQTIESMSDTRYDGEVILPYFREGGRLTIENTHYVKDGDHLVPAGETEFAKDRTFGYTSSDLGEWVEEKSGGRYRAADTTFITLESLRALDVDTIVSQLMDVHHFNKIVVNATEDAEVRVFTTALIRAIGAGKQFLFRTAASFTKIIGGVSDRPLLSAQELLEGQPNGGGLIIVGSHVKKTTAQLEALQQLSGVHCIEFDVHLVTDTPAFEAETTRVITETENLLAEGKTVTVYTKRERLDLGDGRQEDELKQSIRISDAVTSIVQRLHQRPRYLIAKGGITSSDIGTRGLSVQRATVAGQIRPGIPVWVTGSESKFPGLPYIIFPGNVGEVDTLKATVQQLDADSS